MTSPYRPDNPFAKQSRYRPDNPFAPDAEVEEPKRTLGGMVKAAANLALHTNPLTAPFTDTGRKVGRELTQGATFGWGDEGEAALTGALSPGTIKEHLARIRGERQEFKTEHPVAALGSEVLGGFGVGAPGVGALLKGAKGPISQALRLSGIGAGTGAVAGAGMAEDGSRLKGAAIGAGVGAVAAPLIVGGAALLPKLGRLMGITTQGGRSEAALKALNDAVERSGQTLEEVTARAEAMVAAGKTPTLLEALGPGGRTALDAMAPLGNEAAGQAAQAARAAPKGEVAQALARASRRPAAKVGISPFGPKLGLVEKAATMGLRKSASRESEALLNQLLDPASKTFPGRVVGKIEPKVTIAEALAERQAAKADLTTPASGYEPNANPVRESEAFIARKLKHQGIRTPKTRDPIVGAPKPVSEEPSEEELRALAEHLMANQDDNLETLLQLSLQKKKGLIASLLENKRGALGVEGAKPPPLPDKISNPTDPYAEITKSAGPETPELARVKLLRKTLGMKGKLDPSILAMLGASGLASGGALTAALALRRRGKPQQERASKR